MQKTIEEAIREVIRAAQVLTLPESVRFIEQAALMITECYREGGKVLIAGNGGSLCDALHFAEELTGQFRTYRRALPALALADPAHMSCVANDMGFDQVFSRGVEAFGKSGDVLIVLTTSGNSKNIYNAIGSAQVLGLKTIAFLGKSGGMLRGLSDLEWLVEGFSFSDRIQEAHMAALHILVELVEQTLFVVGSTSR